MNLKEGNKPIFFFIVLVCIFLSFSHSLYQLALDGGLALSEKIEYPEPISPMKYYYFNSWTLLYQFSEIFLRFGFSVENISIIIIFLSTLCFALSAFIIVYRFTSNKYLALLVSILMLVLEKNFGDTDYPSLIFSNHSFGKLSLAVSSLIFSLILNKNYKSSGFFSVLLISIHPIVGLWILSILILSMILLKDKKINLDLFKGAIFGSIITIVSFIFFPSSSIGKLDFEPQNLELYFSLWDGHRNQSNYLHYEFLVKTLVLFFAVNAYFSLLKQGKNFFLTVFNSTLIFSSISYLSYKFFPQLFPDFLIHAMPSRFLILHSFVGWPLIISIFYLIFSQFNSTKRFIKIFVFAVLVIHSMQHYKKFIKIQNGFVLNVFEKSYVQDVNIFKDISNLNLEGYFITTSNTANYINRFALKPILLNTQYLDFLPYHHYLVDRTFEILEEVYDVDLKNPPIKNNPLLPDSFVKNNFENKTKLDWESLSQKYNANYVVTPSNWKIKLDLFKNNESFSIYKIK